jgi:flavodoxin
MSSWPIPTHAPFAPEDIESLNRVVGPASPIQRAWLAGFLADVESVTGIAQPALAPQAAEPLTIVFASESGNSEKLAGDMAKSARKLGFRPTIIDMAEVELAQLAKAKRLIVIAATWGEGEPPGRAVRVYNELMSDAAPRLDGVEFGVLALGDTAYAEFCAIGKAIDERLASSASSGHCKIRWSISRWIVSRFICTIVGSPREVGLGIPTCRLESSHDRSSNTDRRYSRRSGTDPSGRFRPSFMARGFPMTFPETVFIRLQGLALKSFLGRRSRIDTGRS